MTLPTFLGRPGNGRFCCFLAISLALLFPARAHARAERSAAVAAALARLENAANNAEVKTLQAAVRPGMRDTFQWAAEPPGMLGTLSAWHVSLLEPPGDGGRTYVAFSRYQPTESTSDHLYEADADTSGVKLGREVPETDTRGYRLRSHDLAVRFDVGRHHVDITDKIAIERGAASAPWVLLRLNSIYRLKSATRDGAAVPFRQAGGFVALLAGHGPSETYDLAYESDIPDSDEDYIKGNEAALTAYWYPQIARLPVTSRVAITAPKTWDAIATGDRVRRTVAGDAATTVWTNSLPICFLSVAAGRYDVTTRMVDGVAVSAYLLKADRARARTAIDTAGKAIHWFSANFAPFPFTHYAVVETHTFPAALECYSWTLVGKRMLPAAIVHEVAHTWWGGVVPNTYTRTLWNESFAEYSDGLYSRATGRTGMNDFQPRLLARSMYRLVSQSTLAQAHDAMGASDSTIGYGKGSLVLANLERMLGRDRMIAAMRRFAVEHRRGADAEWSDFIDAVAKTAGDEWRAFFPAWLERPDLPSLKLTDVRAAQIGARYVVQGAVVQENGPYWLQAPLVVATSRGETRSAVQLRGATRTEFRVETDGAPRQVTLDPQFESLRSDGEGAKPPTLLALHAASSSLLVVYATGGPADEAAALRKVANEDVAGTYPLAQLNVRADTDATEEMLRQGDVLVLGKTENLRLPQSLRSRLPLDITEAAVRRGGEHWTGADLWGLAVTPNPLRPKSLLIQAAGTGPEAIEGFRMQSDLNDDDSFFVVRRDGAVVASLPPPSDDRLTVKLAP